MAFHSTSSDIKLLRIQDRELPDHPKGLRKIAMSDWGMRDVGYFHGFFQVQDSHGKPIVAVVIEWPDGTAEIRDVGERELMFLDSLPGDEATHG